VRAIVEDGHEIGNHTYSHRHLWLLTPRATREEMRRGADVIEAIAGTPVRYFRPPWGKFNLAAYRYATELNQIRVLWSLRPEGWRASAAPASVLDAVRNRLHPGAIVDLHDAGGHIEGDPPAVQALPELLSVLRAREYASLTLREILAPAGRPEAHRGIRQWLWERYESAWAGWFHLEPVGPSSILDVGPVRHKGPATVLEDGTPVRPGDLVADLHFNRRRIAHIHQAHPTQPGLALRRETEAALTMLAGLAMHHPDYARVPAFKATTLFWSTAPRLGFETRPIGSVWMRYLLKCYLRLLLARDHPLGRRRVRDQVLEPRVIWLSRHALIRRYGSHATHDVYREPATGSRR
jgi:hypothetical protein